MLKKFSFALPESRAEKMLPELFFGQWAMFPCESVNRLIDFKFEQIVFKVLMQGFHAVPIMQKDAFINGFSCFFPFCGIEKVAPLIRSDCIGCCLIQNGHIMAIKAY